MSKRPDLQHTDGTAGTIFTVLDCESRHPVLVENRFENEPKSDRRDLLATKVNNKIFTKKERPSYCEQLQKI